MSCPSKWWLFFFLNSIAYASNGGDNFLSQVYVPGSLALASAKGIASIWIDSADFPGCIRAATDLQSDLEKVTGIKPGFFSRTQKPSGTCIIIGTIGHSSLLSHLVENGKITIGDIAGRWESSLLQVVYQPYPGIDSALVIAGSDKRGTIYGIYEVSAQAGVSPWYYWADVPVKKKRNIFALSGRHLINSPAVKYRGIFLNDEAPALSGWAKEKFGGFNHLFYEKVFELILRLRGNYLWPAMWGNAFNVDDTLNPEIADIYGIVMGTSHHEPMLRAQQEWKLYGKGDWNYENNTAVLKDFWKTGIKNMSRHESLVTIGMRGDGDMPMSEESNIHLLEKIVKDQREIIATASGRSIEQTPQVWALYKEVQDYYDRGMRVPDDVTLLLCDDNWGNLRKLPKLIEPLRKGGYGIYYHFDYVGGPRNYKWINTNPIQKVWEQMHLAYAHGADRIWIVNVGDLKPMEFPISFFLDYAWNPAAFPAEKLIDYTEQWCKQQFGETYATEIANIIDLTAKYNGRHKPELLNTNFYSLVNYNEFETMVNSFNFLEARATYIYDLLPPVFKDAFYQLVLHPVQAGSNLNELYFNLYKNKMYAKQGRNATNAIADKVKTLYQKDAAISNFYNRKLSGGKWNHMMDQTHISYTYWQQPDADVLPNTDSIQIFDRAVMGVAIEGSDSSWTGKTTVTAAFPEFNFYTQKQHYLELFNKGNKPYKFDLKAPDYIKSSSNAGLINEEQRVFISINWENVPKRKTKTTIVISGSDGSKITLPIVINNIRFSSKKIHGFVESDGIVSMKSSEYSRAIQSSSVKWQNLDGFGKLEGGVHPIPVTAAPQQLDSNTPRLEFDVYVSDTGIAHVAAWLSPTIDFTNSGGLHYAISIDDEKPQVVNTSAGYSDTKGWEKSVAENIKILQSHHYISTPGHHIIKYWMIHPGVVLQKITLDFGKTRPSDLGAPSTFVFK